MVGFGFWVFGAERVSVFEVRVLQWRSRVLSVGRGKIGLAKVQGLVFAFP